MNHLIIVIAFLLYSTTCWANSTNTINNSEPLDVNHTNTTSNEDTQGRSLFTDLPRQGRIINDDKISIKGFIPIVGLGEDSAKEKNSNNMEKYLKSMSSLPNTFENGNPSENMPQNVPQTEEQGRFIGAALQGLLGNSMKKPSFGIRSGITRKSDCVCVPFYLCKNGILTDSQNQGYGGLMDFSSMYNPQLQTMYEQKRRTENGEMSQYIGQNEDYPSINERSNDNLNNVSSLYNFF